MSNRRKDSVSSLERLEQIQYIDNLKNRIFKKGLKYHIVTYG